MPIKLVSFSLVMVVVSATIYSNDQKQNCSTHATNSYCYNGPRVDLYGQYKSCVVPGVIAITFDDGPSKYTNHILDVLKQYNMKATFNLKGTSIHSFASTIQRMADEGHQIASHTYNHVWLTDCPDVAKEVLDFETAFVSEKFTGILANGVIPNYIRVPHGDVNETVVRIVRDELGYTLIHWGILTHDTETNPPDPVDVYHFHFGGLYGTGVDASKLTVITQHHDTIPITNDTFDVLAKYLSETFGSKGTRFVTVAECLGNIIPPMRPNPRQVPSIIPDPSCKNGIISGEICCLSSCGTCGGTGCSSLVGGSAGCCGGSIQLSGKSCELSSAPCVMKKTTTTTTSNTSTQVISDPYCKNGILSGDICCLSSCGTCGGTGCSLQVGGSAGCCGGSIQLNGKSCDLSTAPCVVKPRIQRDPNCNTGILVDRVCCMASCGTCGGTGCSTRVGGSKGCCGGNIVLSNVSCQVSSPPCIVTV